MKLNFPPAIKVSCIFLATTLVACAGGSSGGYTAPARTTATTPAATASFAQPTSPTTITLSTAGPITKGDLIVCNRIAQSAGLDGCDALALLPDDSIPAAAWSATRSPLVSAAGSGGFCTSGSPGMIFTGLGYDPSNDTLYVVDTSSASVIAIVGISNVSKDGLVANGQCAGAATTPAPVPTFSGPSMISARVITHGAPFNTPLGPALL